MTEDYNTFCFKTPTECLNIRASHYYDQSAWQLVPPNVVAGGIIQALTPVTQGAANNQYLGTVIRPRFLVANYKFFFNNFFPPGGDIGRLIIVLDKQANGALPAVSDIFDNTVRINTYLNMPVFDQMDRFVLLHDEVINVPVTVSAGLGGQIYTNFQPSRLCIDVSNLPPTTYDESGDVITNNYLAIAISEISNIGIGFLSRLYFDNGF